MLLIKSGGPWWFEVGRGLARQQQQQNTETGNNEINRRESVWKAQHERWGRTGCRKGAAENSFTIGLKQVEDFPQKPLLSFTSLQINNLLSERMRCIL